VGKNSLQIPGSQGSCPTCSANMTRPNPIDNGFLRLYLFGWRSRYGTCHSYSPGFALSAPTSYNGHDSLYSHLSLWSAGRVDDNVAFVHFISVKRRVD